MDNKKQKITAMPEYEQPFNSFIHESINLLMWSKNELLSRIADREVKEKVGKIRNAIGEGNYLDNEPKQIASNVELQFESIYTSDIDSFIEMIDKASDSLTQSLMPEIFNLLQQVTEKSGQIIDTKGESFSYKMILDAYEKMEISFDTKGNPILPMLVVNPQVKEILDENPPTDEELKRLNEILEHKKGEYFAKKRSRKLY